MIAGYYQSLVKDYEPETLAYRDRVVTDGGEVIDMDYTDSLFKFLKNNSLLSQCIHLASARAGLKINNNADGKNYVHKAYCLTGADKDLIQTTPGQYPLFIKDSGRNFKPHLIFYKSSNYHLYIDDTLKNNVPSNTASSIYFRSLSSGGTAGAMISKLSPASPNPGYEMSVYINSDELTTYCNKSLSDDALRRITKGGLIPDTWQDITQTYSGSKAKAGVRHFFNKTENSNYLTASEIDTLITDDISNSANFCLGSRREGTTVSTSFNGKYETSAVFTTELTQTLINQLSDL